MNDIEKLRHAIDWLKDKREALTWLTIISIIVAIVVATPLTIIIKKMPPVGIFVAITYISTILLSATRLTGVPLLTVYRKHIIEHRYEKIIHQKELIENRLTEHCFLQETLNDMIRYRENQLRRALAAHEVEKMISVTDDSWQDKPIRNISTKMAEMLNIMLFYYEDLLRYLKETNASKQTADTIADRMNSVLTTELNTFKVSEISNRMIKKYDENPRNAIPKPNTIKILVNEVMETVKE